MTFFESCKAAEAMKLHPLVEWNSLPLSSPASQCHCWVLLSCYEKVRSARSTCSWQPI